MKSAIIKTVILLGVTILFTTGCLPSRGWEVKFGIAPVSRVDNKQGLDQESNFRRANNN